MQSGLCHPLLYTCRLDVLEIGTYFCPDEFSWYAIKGGYNLLGTGRKLNVHKTFRRRARRLLNVLYTFNLRPVPRDKLIESSCQDVSVKFNFLTSMRFRCQEEITS